MWVAVQEYESYEATVRRNGKYTCNDLCMLIRAVFEFDWSKIIFMMGVCCQNKAATCLLDGNITAAETWIARAKAIKGIE